MIHCYKKQIEPHTFEKQCSGTAGLTDDIIIIVQDGILKFANSAMSTVTHWSAKELIGTDFAKFLTEDSCKIIKEEYEKKIAEKEVPHFYKIEIIEKEGNILPVELSAETTEYEGKQAFLFVLRDVTSQERIVEDLQKSEERYRTIIENIEDGYFELDLSGNLTFFNESACRLLGYTREEMMGVNYRQYSNHETIKRMYEAGNKTFRTGEPVKSFDWEVIGKTEQKGRWKPPWVL